MKTKIEGFNYKAMLFKTNITIFTLHPLTFKTKIYFLNKREVNISILRYQMNLCLFPVGRELLPLAPDIPFPTPKQDRVFSGLKAWIDSSVGF